MLILGTMLTTTLAVLFGIVSIFMILVILIQKPKGGGLSGAFGGGGGSDAVFGTKIGDALTWFTVACFVAFMVLGISLTILVHNEQKEISAAPAATIEMPAGETAPVSSEPAADTETPTPEAAAPADAAPAAEPAATETTPAAPAPAEAEKTE